MAKLGTEFFGIKYVGNYSYSPVLTGSKQSELFGVQYIPIVEINVTKFSKSFFIRVWLPIALDYAYQYYEEIYKLSYEKYVSTPLAEFQRYEYHRSETPGFTPTPEGGTKVGESTDIDQTAYFDEAPTTTAKYYYIVMVVMDDGTYTISNEYGGRRKPLWDAVPWTDALVKNNDGDEVGQGSPYNCECSTATDPEGKPVAYRFNVLENGDTPSTQIDLTYPLETYLPNYLLVSDKVFTVGSYDVQVNDVEWTYIGDDPAAFSGYGPTDEVYVYDPKNYCVIFGDGTNGKEPTTGDSIKLWIRPWVAIDQTDLITDNTPTWNVPEDQPTGLKYEMRVYPQETMDTPPATGYMDVSDNQFEVYTPPPGPVMVAPCGTVENSFQPQFMVYNHGASLATEYFKFIIYVSTTPDISGVVKTYSMLSEPDEWMEESYLESQMAYFVPSYDRKIDPNGTYYCWAYGYSVLTGRLTAQSNICKFDIEGATYKWRIGLPGGEIEFLPRPQGWSMDIQHIGRQLVEKKLFTVDFALMDEDKRNLLFTEFSRRTILTLHDNMGNNYQVFWGNCDRNISGKAHSSRSPDFGIKQIHHISGNLKWGGQSVFTEV